MSLFDVITLNAVSLDNSCMKASRVLKGRKLGTNGPYFANIILLVGFYFIHRILYILGWMAADPICSMFISLLIAVRYVRRLLIIISSLFHSYTCIPMYVYPCTPIHILVLPHGCAYLRPSLVRRALLLQTVLKCSRRPNCSPIFVELWLSGLSDWSGTREVPGSSPVNSHSCEDNFS